MSKKQNITTNPAKPDKPVITVKVAAGAKSASTQEAAPPEKATPTKTGKKAIGKSEAPARDTSSVPSPASTSKIDTVITMLRAKEGASIEQVIKATGWQAHSVRGAISGHLKKKLGLNVVSEKMDGTRLYRIAK
jgi:hypothetical protein